MQYASISKRLLRELPRFFSSFEGALGEIFQNALRAGATCVEVFWDEGRSVLTVVDDGGGIENADMLLTAGATGWTEAIEPAGVGFFALLRPEWVRRVTYRSR
ncbi:MAG: ATP-binding protein, partial [Candidatus Methanomethyliaceae archaeon]